MFIAIMLFMVYEFAAIAFRGVTSAFSYVFLSFFGSILLVIFLDYKYPNDDWIWYTNVLSAIYIVINIIYLLIKKKSFLSIEPGGLQTYIYVLQAYLYIAIPSVVLLFWLKSDLSNKWILLAIFVMIWASDVGAYFTGKAFGKRKLMESVSPNKTWAGFIGGGIATIALSFAASYFLPEINAFHWLIIGILIWFFGSMGDLCESAFKRFHQVKDSGTLLPGHGGFLDRLDSFIFAVPIVLLYLKMIHV